MIIMKAQMMLLAVSLLIVSIVFVVIFRLLFTSTTEVTITAEENYANLVSGVITSIQTLEGDVLYINPDFPKECEVEISGNTVSFKFNSESKTPKIYSSIIPISDIEVVESKIDCSDFKIKKEGNKISLGDN